MCFRSCGMSDLQSAPAFGFGSLTSIIDQSHEHCFVALMLQRGSPSWWPEWYFWMLCRLVITLGLPLLTCTSFPKAPEGTCPVFPCSVGRWRYWFYEHEFILVVLAQPGVVDLRWVMSFSMTIPQALRRFAETVFGFFDANTLILGMSKLPSYTHFWL